MALTPLDITDGFRWILGRDPSDVEIRRCAALKDWRALRTELLGGADFLDWYIHARRPATAPDLALDRQRIVFLHIPKCGGTSLRTALESAVPAELVCPERFNNLRDWTLGELASFTLFSGHFDYQSCRALPGRNTTIVTLLREPRQRLLSLYYFLKAHRHEIVTEEKFDLALLARQLEPEAFFDHPTVKRHPAILDTVTRTFATRLPQGRWERIGDPVAEDDPLRTRPQAMVGIAWRMLQKTWFGLLDDFDRSLTLIAQALNLTLRPVPPRFVLAEVMLSSPRMEPVELRPMTTALDAALDRLTGCDRILYRRAVALFERRARALEQPDEKGEAALAR